MPQKITLYALSTCSHCKATKKLLNQCAVPYEETDVDQLDSAEREAVLVDVKKLNPNCSFPTLVIDDKVIVGYREAEIKEALGIT